MLYLDKANKQKFMLMIPQCADLPGHGMGKEVPCFDTVIFIQGVPYSTCIMIF